MGKYQKYIFDQNQRKFIGDFEKMYSNEVEEKFDSWHQSDTRFLGKN